MSWKKQPGFTLIELMIAVAILAILLNVAVPAYLKYAHRAKVGASIALASGVKTAVGEHYSSTAVFPSSNNNAGAPEPETITSEYVNSVGIEVNPESGTVKINYKDFGPIEDGNVLMLVPAACNGSIRWVCTTEDINDSYIPAACRGSFNANNPCAVASTGPCGSGSNCSGGGDGTNPGGGGNDDGTNNPGNGKGGGKGKKL